MITATPGVGELVIFFDEFDQLLDSGSVVLLANTIKALSDKAEPVTIIPVGVAHSVDDLIEAHQSVRRSLAQVPMPRMSRAELREIVTRGLAELDMTASGDALAFTETVPRGLPHYAHLLAQEGARQALMRRSLHIGMQDMVNGLRVGLDKVDHTLTTAYDEATYSPQKSARFREVLLACALAEPDEHGFFAASDLRDPYSAVVGEAKDIGHYNPQLEQLCEGRGQVLTRTGAPYRWRYRFSDPLMEPFVLLRGIDDGLVTPSALLGRRRPAPESSEQARLF
jgi:Cdc6-like AAA superfamily ATPase